MTNGTGAPTVLDEPPSDPIGPVSYLELVPTDDNRVAGVVTYDQPQSGLDPLRFVEATPEQLAAIEAPGTHYLETDGTITTVPPPPPAIVYTQSIQVDQTLRTTDDLEHDVFVVAAELKSIYRGHLLMTAIDSGNGAVKSMEGILVWKRLLGANVIAPPGNVTVISDVHDTAAASWVMNGLPSGGTFRIFVKGALGRTIDWNLTGEIGRYAPDGVTSSLVVLGSEAPS